MSRRRPFEGTSVFRCRGFVGTCMQMRRDLWIAGVDVAGASVCCSAKTKRLAKEAVRKQLDAMAIEFRRTTLAREARETFRRVLRRDRP